MYCKETDEEITGTSDIDGKIQHKCLIHGWQPLDHFEEEPDNKICAVCGKRYWCKDDIRKVCSMGCAGEYNG